MSEPFLAEIKIVGFNFAPRNWAFCDGQILPINQNQSLFSLLGTSYGGDGRTSFALPDLRGRAPVHVGGGLSQAQRGGEETHVLTAGQIPAHDHTLNASGDVGVAPVPNNRLLANAGSDVYAVPNGGAVAMNAGTISNAGANQGHQNMQPYLTLNFVIALQGLFPSRN